MIAIASDHAGLPLKRALVALLKEKGYDFQDLGCHEDERVNYTDYALLVAEGVAGGAFHKGVLVCGTGIGMAMAAGKVPGVRAAVCNDAYCARMTRLHNDANVLTMGARVVGAGVAEDILLAFLDTPFEGGRHCARVEHIARIEEKYIGKRGD